MGKGKKTEAPVPEWLASTMRIIAAFENLGIKPTRAAQLARIDAGYLRRIRDGEIEPGNTEAMVLRLERVLQDETAARFRNLAELALADPVNIGMLRALEPSARMLAATLRTALDRIDSSGWPGGDTSN